MPPAPTAQVSESPVRHVARTSSIGNTLEYVTQEGVALCVLRPRYLGLMVASYGIPGNRPPPSCHGAAQQPEGLQKPRSLCQHLDVTLPEVEVALRAEVDRLKAELSTLKSKHAACAPDNDEQGRLEHEIDAIYIEIVR